MRMVQKGFGIGLALLLMGLPAWAMLRVVTTVAPLTDLVKQVGGPFIEVHGLVPPGVNSHTFHPTPLDARYLANADVVILNGLFLEIPTEQMASRVGNPGLKMLKLGDQTLNRRAWIFDRSFPASNGYPNPHLWLNVNHAMTYTALIEHQLSALAPEHQQSFRDRATRYQARLQQLDRCLTTALATIPSQHRKLLTYHDSWPYFAERYGMTIIGAVQPASFMEPSPREVARLIDQIRQTKVPAVFGSEVFPSPILTKIAAETGVRYVDTLRDDILPGKPGDAEHSYMGLMLSNVQTMVEALGGQTTSLSTCMAEGEQH